MKEILTYILALILAIGIIFITTECEVYFGEINHLFITNTMPADKTADIEHTHVSHHLVNDLFSETIEDSFRTERIVSIKGGTPNPFFKNNYFTSFWQPPKFF